MKTCKKCKKDFPILLVINGKTRNLGSRNFCLNCSPFGQHNTRDISGKERIRSLIYQISDEDFKSIIAKNRSRSAIFDELRMRKSSTSFRILNRRIFELGLDTKHFQLGGEIAKRKILLNNTNLFVENQTKVEMVRRRILKEELIEYRCAECKLKNVWNNKPITLELDHINGERYDNRLSNLRWLCPNCHSQTTTYCRKFKEKKH